MTTTETESNGIEELDRPENTRPEKTVTTDTRPLVPIPSPIVKLAEGHRACLDCGVAVPEDGTHPHIELDTIGPFRGLPRDLATVIAKGQQGTPVTIAFTRCPECRLRERLAETALGPDAPGSEVHKLRSALHVLALLDQPVPGVVGDRRARQQVVRHLLATGISLRWAARFLPVITPGANPDTCSSAPWAHVTADQRTAARQAYARYLAAKVAVPVRLPAPTPPPPCDALTGCLYCGVAALVFTSDRPQQWRPVIVTTPPGIGAPPMGGQPVTGYLCPPCSDATDNAAAVGRGAIHRSLRDHLAATGDESTLERLGRLDGTELPPTITWVSLVLRARRTGRPVPGPNTTRWGHLTLV